jgi:hypothetical protein
VGLKAPLTFIMRRLIFSILLILSSNIFAKDEVVSTVVEPDISVLQVSQLFDSSNKLDKRIKYIDLVAKEEKITICIVKYVEDQTKSWAKIPQNDLYDLLNNFGKIASRIQGKKVDGDDIPYDEKLEALANVQCEAYYALGVLR